MYEQILLFWKFSAVLMNVIDLKQENGMLCVYQSLILFVQPLIASLMSR